MRWLRPHALLTLVVVLPCLASSGTAGAAEPLPWSLSAPLRQGGDAPIELRASAPPPLRLAERAGTANLAELRAAVTAARAELDDIALWNRTRRVPARNGFARDLPAPKALTFGPELGTKAAGEHAGGRFERASDGGLVWGAAVRVEGAHRLRLHLSGLDLPKDALLWVYGAGEAVGPFGLELAGPAGDLWTPSVGGETIRLELKLAAGAEPSRFTLDQVLELFELGADGAPAPISTAAKGESCLVDVQCVTTGTFDVVDLARHGVAAIEFVDGYFGFFCSGGLLNDLSASGIPYLLTANHCFDDQDSAATVEAFWDFFTPSCGGTPPNPGGLPRSNGSRLLTSSALSDFTLVRLNNLPGSRTFLGWAESAVPHNTVLHRISHPLGLHQHYSRNHVDSSAVACNGAPRPDFLYETFFPGQGDQGGTFGGSSGSPAMLAGGLVVGQLTGACGLNPEDGCDYSNAEVDGALSESFDSIGPFLTDTLPLLSGRFEVTMDWRSSAGSGFQPARLLSSTDNAGNLYFNNPNNAELLIKVLNACSLNNRYWVFYAATTNVQFTITVTDTLRGVTKTYTNPLNNPAGPIQDTNAFATCP